MGLDGRQASDNNFLDLCYDGMVPYMKKNHPDRADDAAKRQTSLHSRSSHD